MSYVDIWIRRDETTKLHAAESPCKKDQINKSRVKEMLVIFSDTKDVVAALVPQW